MNRRTTLILLAIVLILLAVTGFKLYERQAEPKVKQEQVAIMFGDSNSMTCDTQNGTPVCDNGNCTLINGTYWCMPVR